MKKTIPTNTILTTREFIRNFSKIIKTPKSKVYTIVKHGKPIATVIPHLNDDAWWEGLDSNQYPETQSSSIKDKKRVTLADLEALRFHSGEKNLSERIDEIVYGIGR